MIALVILLTALGAYALGRVASQDEFIGLDNPAEFGTLTIDVHHEEV